MTDDLPSIFDVAESPWRVEHDVKGPYIAITHGRVTILTHSQPESPGALAIWLTGTVDDWHRKLVAAFNKLPKRDPKDDWRLAIRQQGDGVVVFVWPLRRGAKATEAMLTLLGAKRAEPEPTEPESQAESLPEPVKRGPGRPRKDRK